MDKLRIALLQISSNASKEENLKKGLEYCEKAKSLGADICLFPEMFSNGYNLSLSIEELNRNALSIDSEYIKAFGRRAS